MSHQAPCGTTVTVESEELVVLDHVSGSRFSDHGDSGALVRNVDDGMVGMLWGGLYPGFGRKKNNSSDSFLITPPDHWPLDLSSVALVTPMKTLMEDMEREVQMRYIGVRVKLHLLPETPSEKEYLVAT